MKPRMMGEEANRRAVANERRRHERIVWIIYGG